MPSLLDNYQIPSDLPDMNVNPDPELLKRMQYLGLMRMGAGLMGREPLGSAMSAGMSTIAEGQTQARAEHRANMELILKQHQAKQQQIDDMNKAKFLGSQSVEELGAMGIPQSAAMAIKYSKDPVAAYQALVKPFIEPYTLGSDSSRMIGNQQIATRPNAQGIVYPMQNGAPTQALTVPGYQQAVAQGEGMNTAAKTANTMQTVQGPNGPVSGFLGDPGMPATPPAMRGATATAIGNGSLPQFHGTMNPNEVNRAMQDFTGAKPFEKQASIEGQNPIDVTTKSDINKTVFTQLQKDALLYRDTPDALMQIYRAQDALNSKEAFAGGAAWKGASVNALNSLLPAGFRFNITESMNAAELQKALGSQLIDNARAFGANPTAAEEKRLDAIIGSANDPREALLKALPYAEQIIRRSATDHNKRVSQFESKYPLPVDLKTALPSREEILKQVGGQPTAQGASAAAVTLKQPSATELAYAKANIAKGANPAAVAAKMRERGFDPAALAK